MTGRDKLMTNSERMRVPIVLMSLATWSRRSSAAKKKRNSPTAEGEAAHRQRPVLRSRFQCCHARGSQEGAPWKRSVILLVVAFIQGLQEE